MPVNPKGHGVTPVTFTVERGLRRHRLGIEQQEIIRFSNTIPHDARHHTIVLVDLLFSVSVCNLTGDEHRL